MHVFYDMHHKVSSLTKVHQDTPNSVKYGVVWNHGVLIKQYLCSILDIINLTTASYGQALAFQIYMTRDKRIFKGFYVIKNREHFDCSYTCVCSHSWLLQRRNKNITKNFSEKDGLVLIYWYCFGKTRSSC